MRGALDELRGSVQSFLERNLPLHEPDGWNTYVLNQLSFEQRRVAEEGSFSSLSDFDLVSLVRLFDRNWCTVSQQFALPAEAREWLKEVPSIRIRWTSRPRGELNPADESRDLDVISRLVRAIGGVSGGNALVGANNRTNPKGVGDRESSAVPQLPSTPFEKGTIVRLKAKPGLCGAVVDVHPAKDQIRYSVFHDGSVSTYYESQLEAANDRAQRSHVTPDELHAALTALQLRHPSTAHLYSLYASRINFVPYQFRPVLKLIQSERPRLLIADEVGVGKTIEAGLILKELQARRDIRSVLVICPKALVTERKWMEELRRFDEQFVHLDGNSLQYCLDETHLDGVWPQQYSKAILPYSLFSEELLVGKQKGKRRQRGLYDLDPPPVFDLVIVDEAHHIRNTDTWAYQTVRYFSDNAEAAVLLSATPIQLAGNDLFNLLNLLRPDLLPTRQHFDQIAEPNPHINAAIETVRRARPGWRLDSRKCIEAAVATTWGRGVLMRDPRLQEVYDSLGTETDNSEARLELIHQLEGLYTFSPMINRTRRRDIGNFTLRKPETVTVEFTPEQAALHDDVVGVVAEILEQRHGDQNLKFMLSTLQRQVASCVFGLVPLLKNMLNRQLTQLELAAPDDNGTPTDLNELMLEYRAQIEALVERAHSIPRNDPKFDAFLKVVREKQERANNKLLVFSTFRHTLAYLVDRLQCESIRIGLIHGDVADDERRELKRRFSLPREREDAIDVLLTSEVGCEGLDFQFCDALVNYDLPWNPMRVEQRIGRIDRYGQTSDTVVVYNLITPGTVDAEIYERCLVRIGVFRQALGGSEEILGKLTREIRDIAENLSLTRAEREQRLQQLSDNEIRKIQEQDRLEREQSAFFGLSLPSGDASLMKQVSSFWLSPARIANLVEKYLDSLGVSSLPCRLSQNAIINLQISQEVRDKLFSDFKLLDMSVVALPAWVRWLKGSEPNLSMTFDQVSANARRDVEFITPTHPLARQAALRFEPEGVVHTEMSAVSTSVVQGRYPFAIYRWRKLGLKEDFMFRAVAQDSSVSEQILELLENAVAESEVPGISAAEVNALETVHYQAWMEARDKHIEDVANVASARLASLRTTHEARMAALAQQRDDAGETRIRRMRESQLATAQSDFDRRKRDLELAIGLGEIVTEPVAYGVLVVRGGD